MLTVSARPLSDPGSDRASQITADLKVRTTASDVVQAFGPAGSGGQTTLPTNGAATTAQLLSELIRVDNRNPPGHERQLDDLLAATLQRLGFEIEIVPTPETGKPHLLARLRGDGSKKPILLAAHADTVGVERNKWSVDPFAGVVQAGTDAMAWRSRGIPVYGIYPYPITADELTRMHGNDERVSVQSLEQGTQMIDKTLVEIAGKK